MTLCVRPAGVFPILNPEMFSCAHDSLAAGTKQGVCHEWEWSEVSVMVGQGELSAITLVQEGDTALHRATLLLWKLSE